MSSAKEPDRFLWSIALHLSGLGLDPAVITGILNIPPTLSFKLGEIYEIPEEKMVRRRNGVWVIKQTSESAKPDDFDRALESFGDEIEPLLLRLKKNKLSLEELPGVERAHVDILIIASINAGEPTKRAFRISANNARWMADLNLPIDFTVDNIIEPDLNVAPSPV